MVSDDSDDSDGTDKETLLPAIESYDLEDVSPSDEQATSPVGPEDTPDPAHDESNSSWFHEDDLFLDICFISPSLAHAFQAAAAVLATLSDSISAFTDSPTDPPSISTSLDNPGFSPTVDHSSVCRESDDKCFAERGSNLIHSIDRLVKYVQCEKDFSIVLVLPSVDDSHTISFCSYFVTRDKHFSFRNHQLDRLANDKDSLTDRNKNPTELCSCL